MTGTLTVPLARLGPKIAVPLCHWLRTLLQQPIEVQRIHLLHGIDALEPALLDWELASAGALEQPRDGAAKNSDLANLWARAQSILKLNEGSVDDYKKNSTNDGAPTVELPFRRTLSDWIDELADTCIVTTIDGQMIKWVSSFIDEGMAGGQCRISIPVSMQLGVISRNMI